MEMFNPGGGENLKKERRPVNENDLYVPAKLEEFRQKLIKKLPKKTTEAFINSRVDRVAKKLRNAEAKLLEKALDPDKKSKLGRGQENWLKFTRKWKDVLDKIVNEALDKIK